MEEGTELKPLEEATILNHDYMSISEQGEQNGIVSPDDDDGKDAGENEELGDDHGHLSMEDVAYYRFAALLVAWLSVVLLIILAIFSFTASVVTGSSAAFGFGFDCILDVFTSMVVIWRFIGPVGNIYSPEKERMALNLLGGFFILACLAILIRSIPELINAVIPDDVVMISFQYWNHDLEKNITFHGGVNQDLGTSEAMIGAAALDMSNWVLIIASASSVICFGLAIAKFYLAGKLDSQTLQSDGYSSLAGAITSVTWVISAFIIKENHNLWYIDDVVGICVALLLLYYGINLLCRNLPATIRQTCGTEKEPL